MIPEIFTILSNNSTVTAILGINPVRVFPWGEAPQGVEYPYATYGVYSGSPENSMDRVPELDMLGTQVDVWAKTGNDCIQAAKAIRDAIEPTNHMISMSNMERDRETKSYRIRMDFDMYTFR